MEPTVGDMRSALESLSASLPEAYKKTIGRIQALPEKGCTRIGMDALRLVCFAERPLCVSTLLEALSIRDDHTSRSKDHRPALRTVLECCQGLLVVDSPVVRLAHSSIKDYLTSNTETPFPLAQVDMSKLCLRYLVFGDFASGPVETPAAINQRLTEYPFLSYAACYWGVHARGWDNHDQLQPMIGKFFGMSANRSSSEQTFTHVNNFRWEYCSPKESYSVTPLLLASWYGLDHTVVDMLENNSEDINTKTSIGSTALIYAAGNGQLPMIRILLDHGADPYRENWYGGPLACAAEAGHADAIRLLATYGPRHGRMPTGRDPRYKRLPLSCARDHGHVDAIKALVELGAPLAEAAADHWCQCCEPSATSFLHQAAVDDAASIVKAVLDCGWAEVNARCDSGMTALHHAAVAGSLNAARVLLEAGADKDLLDRNGSSALDYMTGKPLDWRVDWYPRGGPVAEKARVESFDINLPPAGECWAAILEYLLAGARTDTMAKSDGSRSERTTTESS